MSKTETRNVVFAPRRIPPSAAAVLASSITGKSVSTDAVRYALRHGYLHGTCPHNGLWRIRREAVIAWAEVRKRRGAA